MESKVFLERLDSNRDEQVDEVDVRILGKTLSDQWTNLAEYIRSDFENNNAYQEVMFAIRPSFDALIQWPDFFVDASLQTRENIILLQFYAKFFGWKRDTIIDGKYSKGVEDLYLGSALRTRKLDDATFGSEKEVDIFKKWLSINDSITLQVVSRKEFETCRKSGEISIKNNRKWDGNDKPQWYDLRIPADLKDGEIPLIMQQINIISYGTDLPEHTAYKTFQGKLDGYVSYLEGATDEFRGYPEYAALLKKTKDMLEQNYAGQKMGNRPDPREVKNGIDTKIDLQFRDVSNPQILRGKEDPSVRLKMIESLIAKELNQYLQLAVFERGTETLFDYMTAARASDMQYLLDPEKRKEAGITNIENGQLERKIGSMQDVKSKLKDTLRVEDNKRRLGDVMAFGNPEEISRVEQEISNEILMEIARYPWTLMDSSEDVHPSKMLESQRMVCAGKSIIAHAFLQELGIQHETLNVWGHSALMVHLSNGKEYYFDPTNATELAEFTGLERVGNGVYEKGKLILRNSFVEWWTIQMGSNGAMTDKDGLLHFSRSDSEFWLMGQVYNNRSTDEDLRPDEKILFMERVMELSPNEISVYANGVSRYAEIWNYKRAIELGEKWLKLDPDSIAIKINLSNVYWNMAFNCHQRWDRSGALEHAQKSLTYFEHPSSLNFIGFVLLDTRKPSEAIAYFTRAIESGKKFYIDSGGKNDQISEPLANLRLALAQLPDDAYRGKKNETLRTLGSAFTDMGRYPEARAEFESVLKDEPDSWLIHYRLWVVDFQEDRYDDCLKRYSEAIRLAPDDKLEGLQKELRIIQESIAEALKEKN